MNKKKLFDSDLLNEQLELGRLGEFNGDLITRKFFEGKAGIEGKSIMIELFPNNRNNLDTYFYDKQLKNKMIYRLKKEGFKFVPYFQMTGFYLKEIL
jgi:hypothetical protein